MKEFIYDTGGFFFKIRYLPKISGKEDYSDVYCLGNNLCVFNDEAKKEDFLKLCEYFETTRKDFFGNTMVYLEILGKIKLSSCQPSIDDLKFWIEGFFLPKLQHLVFPDVDVSVYTSTQKESEKDGYSEEKHRDLYEKVLKQRGFTPVEVVIYSRFDFTGVLTY